MGRDDNKPLEERVDNLANVVFALNRTVKEELIPQIKDFSTTADVQERVDNLAKRQKRFTVFFTIGTAFVVFVLVFTVIGVVYRVTHDETIQRRRQFCIQQNKTNHALRDIVDRSINSSQNYDFSKLSPETKKILTEVATANQEGNGKAFRDFVYALTPITKCN